MAWLAKQQAHAPGERVQPFKDERAGGRKAEVQQPQLANGSQARNKVTFLAIIGFQLKEKGNVLPESRRELHAPQQIRKARV